MNADDKKNLWIAGIILIILVGILAGTRGCDKKEYKDDLVTPTPSLEPSPTPNVENNSWSVEKKKNQIVAANTEVVPTVSETPSIDLDTYFQGIASSYEVEWNDSLFVLPQIVSDGKVTVKTEYYFKGIYELSYTEVDGFSTDVLGEYKIVYTVTYKQMSQVKEVLVTIQDNVAPTIDGMIETENIETGTTTYQPVPSGAKTNQAILLFFADNDAVTYVEYYKAKYEWIGGENTLEQEGMQDVEPIVDFQDGFRLTSEGEYHIRAYDSSNNCTEYIVTIDQTPPEATVVTEQIGQDQMKVVISSQEELQPLEGWTRSEDGKSLIRIYTVDTEEEIILYDMAGNETSVTISVKIEPEDPIVYFEVYQAGQVTTSRNLNTNDGDIFIHFHAQKDVVLFYSIDGDLMQEYHGEQLTRDGHYVFQAMMGDCLLDAIELDISSMSVED